MINTKKSLYSGKIYVKNLFDVGGKIDLEKSMGSCEESLQQYNFKIYRESTSLALAFGKAYNIYEDRFPLVLKSNENNHNSNLKCLESLFIRIYSSGVCSINLILGFSDAAFSEIKTSVNGIMNVFEKEDTSVVFNGYSLREYTRKIISDLKEHVTFSPGDEGKNKGNKSTKKDKKRKRSVAEIRRGNLEKMSLGISVVYMPSNLSDFNDSKTYLENYGRHLHSNLLIRAPVKEERVISDVLLDPNIKLLPLRYKDDLIALGRHALLLYVPSRSQSFIDGAELVYEMARVQRFLIKTHSNVARIYTQEISELISRKDMPLRELGDAILDINKLRAEILSTTAELTDYPSMVVNLYLIKIFQETLDIGYGHVEFKSLEKSIDNLDELVRNIYEILKIRSDEITQKELTRLQLIFVIGVSAQLLAFLTQKAGFYPSSVFWIISSVLFATGIFIIIRLVTRIKR